MVHISYYNNISATSENFLLEFMEVHNTSDYKVAKFTTTKMLFSYYIVPIFDYCS